MNNKLKDVIDERITRYNLKNMANEVSNETIDEESPMNVNRIRYDVDKRLAHYAAERLKYEICRLIDQKLANILDKSHDDLYEEKSIW